MFSAVRKRDLIFFKSFHMAPVLGDLKECFDGRKAQNKQADGCKTKISTSSLCLDESP